MSFKQIKKEDKVRPEGKNCIIVYGYDETDYNKINLYSEKMDIDISIKVNKNELGNKIKDIIDENMKNISHKNDVNSKLILFNAVSNYELHSFIEHFNELNIEKPLYAVVTPTSINWNLGDLIEELIRERINHNRN